MNLLAEVVFARPDLSLAVIWPLALMGLLMVGALLLDLKPSSDDRRSVSMLFSAIGLLGLIVYQLQSPNSVTAHSFNGMLANDSFSRAAGILIAGCALLTILAGQEELARFGSRQSGEFVALVLGASIGMVLMSSALNTMVMFLGLELFSIALYLLCIFFVDRESCHESGIKYFLLSSAASAILLYGLAMLYGATGTTWISEMAAQPEQLTGPLALVGAVLVLCGLLFKLAAVPFHHGHRLYVGGHQGGRDRRLMATFRGRPRPRLKSFIHHDGVFAVEHGARQHPGVSSKQRQADARPFRCG